MRTVAGGDYIHISLRHALPIALHEAGASCEQLLISGLKVQLNMDGIPIFSSKNYTSWPILAKVMEPVQTKVFVVGLYGGDKKPNSFYRPWLTRLGQSTTKEGFSAQSQTVSYRCQF